MGNVLAYGYSKGIEIAEKGCRLLELKSEIVDAATKRAKTVRKVTREARYAAKEFIDTATFAVKKHPAKTVFYTFGTAFTIGALAGFLATRAGRGT